MANEIEIKVPDIGSTDQVDVIELLVQAGSVVEKDQSLVTLEGDKATMDIPSPAAGTVKAMRIKVGDKVVQGSLILILDAEEPSKAVEIEEPKKVLEVVEPPAPVIESPPAAPVVNVQSIDLTQAQDTSLSAGPAVRRMARELGVQLTDLLGSGRKSRITKEDIHAYVKSRLSQPSGTITPARPFIDFTQFGDTEIKPLNKIKKMTAINVHRSWISIPHVTQFDEADITELEAFRQSESKQANSQGYKLTLLAFVCAVVTKALQIYPQFNASLDASGENLIYKKYYNLGIAVETPNGLVVPVIKNVDTLSVSAIAMEMARLSTKAREKGLMPADMSGGCFTLSSLGGIGGTGFTPIVNSPEVAILGLSRSTMKPVYEQGEFKPKLILPLSLSYDHRVIDGAEAARFTRFIAESLSDIRKILL